MVPMTLAKSPLVLVVEDSTAMRHAIRDFIALSWPALKIREAADGSSALAALEAHEPALALVDIHLPDISGIEVIRATKARRPGTAVLAMSITRQKHLVDGALAAGAAAFISKETIFSELPVLIVCTLEQAGMGAISAAQPVDSGISDTANRPSNT